MRIKIKLKSVLLYAAYAAATVCINYSAGGAPLAFGLCFAFLCCGGNLFAVPVIYALAAVPSLNWITILLALFEGGFTCAVTAIYRRAHKKIKYEFPLLSAVALAPFIAFSPWRGIENLYFTDNVYIIKAVAAVASVIFALFCLKAVYALLYRLCRSRMRAEEIVCLALVFTIAGIGFYNLAGLYITFGAALGIAVFCVRLYKGPAALAVACVLGLPLLCTTFSGDHVAALLLITCLCLLFSHAGRAAPAAVGAGAGAVYFFIGGAFGQGIVWGVIYILALFIFCFATAVPSESAMEKLFAALSVKSTLSERYEERFKERTSTKLFKISRVFREIESAFLSLDEAPGEGAMQERISGELKARLCSRCDRRERCARTDVYKGFEKLLHTGRIKGKVSLVDLPQEVTVNCAHPADVIATANAGLARLKKLSAEAESAASGRRLLAGQARGISEVLKGAAIDLSKSGARDFAKEKAATAALADSGICTTEMRICADEGGQVIVTVSGEVKAAKVKACLKDALGREYVLKDRIAYGAGLTCYIFVAPPMYDAAFGVAFAVKDGESASGDTHSVIKINEHAFMMALCDGMGSGARAKKVSSATISLIEAFFKAEMPCRTTLETVNKLMSYSRDESFTCMDIAAIDLETLEAGFIKIGSPVSIIIKSDGIKVMESASLPLGILDSIKPTVCEDRLQDGDIVVFMSDGITSAFPSASDMYAYFEKLKPLNPQDLAEKILAAAKKAQKGKCADDMTVLCVRIFSKN